MSNATHNAAIDYFDLEEATSAAFKLTSSAENRSVQTASGVNNYGDVAVVDPYGEIAEPSAEYDVIDTVRHDPEGTALVVLGTVGTPQGIAEPVVLGTLTISTQTGTAPTVSASGKAVQANATQLRAYKLPAFTLSPRHRAQDFLGLCTIKKGAEAASDIDDYGYSSVKANFPIEITLAQPQGVTKNYDLHGGMATVDFAMNWYGATAPTIGLTAAANALGATTSPVASRSDPDNGYTEYTWQISFPLKGEEAGAQGRREDGEARRHGGETG